MPIKKPGDAKDVLRLAHEAGVGVRDILGSGENKELFASRDPGVLFKEDEVWVPDPKPKKLPVSEGTTYLVHTPARRTLHLKLHDESGAPRQVDYTLTGFQYDGTETAKLPSELYGFAYQGVVHEELPAAVTKLLLVLEDDKENPIELHLGRLEPVTTTRGVKARLRNLGFHVSEINDDFDLLTIQALRCFQRIHGLPPSGHGDPATRKKLVEAHGA